MSSPWQKFEVSDSTLESLGKMLDGKSEIFSFRSDPLLASLLCCLGLQLELGKKDQDRLSFLLGVDLEKESANPWHTEIITYDNQIGIRAWIPGRKELLPKHEDFRHILHPLSLSSDALLNQIVIFPMLVAEEYEKRGLELVVVKDWVKSAFLSKNKNLNYQKTNLEEIEGNIALTQICLMEGRQLSFTGTHDVADHLLGGNRDGILKSDELLEKIDATFFPVSIWPEWKKSELVVSYLIAVMLDDLAQPQWYGSPRHIKTVKKSLQLIRELRTQRDLDRILLPDAFHSMVKIVRDRQVPLHEIDGAFRAFALSLQQLQQLLPHHVAVARAKSEEEVAFL